MSQPTHAQTAYDQMLDSVTTEALERVARTHHVERDGADPAASIGWELGERLSYEDTLRDIARTAAACALSSAGIDRPETPPSAPSAEDMREGRNTLVKITRTMLVRQVQELVVALPAETVEDLCDDLADTSRVDDEVLERGVYVDRTTYEAVLDDERTLAFDATVNGEHISGLTT